MRRRGLARMRAVAAVAPSGSHFDELFKRDRARVSQRLSELIAVDTCAHFYYKVCCLVLPSEIHAAEPQGLLEIQIQENMKDIAYSVRRKSKD